MDTLNINFVVWGCLVFNFTIAFAFWLGAFELKFCLVSQKLKANFKCRKLTIFLCKFDINTILLCLNIYFKNYQWTQFLLSLHIARTIMGLDQAEQIIKPYPLVTPMYNLGPAWHLKSFGGWNEKSGTKSGTGVGVYNLYKESEFIIYTHSSVYRVVPQLKIQARKNQRVLNAYSY